ncbi:MAG: aminotransferase class V-fold PLP-dependent enzyme [Bacteroidota bacterium]
MLTDSEISHFRYETPGCDQVIHLNNAGAGLMSLPVLQAMQYHLQKEAEIGAYEAANWARDSIDDSYTQVARYLGCQDRNIAMVQSSTDAYAKALSSIPFQPGDVILTTQNDYSSNQLAFLSMKKRMGIEVVFAPDTSEGGVDVPAMVELMNIYSPKLVAVTHIPTNSGLVQPITEIGQHCKSRDILFLVDACQSVGQMPLDVNAIACDFLTASFRKFLRGPRGLGFLYVSDKALEKNLEPLFIDLRGSYWKDAEVYEAKPDAKRFEFWEQSFALILGAGACVKYALHIGLESIQQRTFSLAAYTREKLADLPGIRVLDEGRVKSGIVTFHQEEIEATELQQRLTQKGINCSIAFRENAVRDFDRKGVPWALRLSPHYYNTYEEVDRALGVLR